MVLDMDNNELALVIVMNAPFGKYGEIFDDDGNVTHMHNRDYKPIMYNKRTSSDAHQY